jgi:hypothetical protein
MQSFTPSDFQVSQLPRKQTLLFYIDIDTAIPSAKDKCFFTPFFPLPCNIVERVGRLGIYVHIATALWSALQCWEMLVLRPERHVLERCRAVN